MSKPSIAELLNASGYSAFTPELVQRASATVYGNLGANRDDRNWGQILSAADPLAAAEEALRLQWQDPSYLLSNAAQMLSAGYSAAAIELTYRQMADRLDFTYSSSWSKGSTFEVTSAFGDADLRSDIEAHTVPNITLRIASSGASAVVSHAGTLSYSVSGSSSSTASGEGALNTGASVREGFLTITRDNGVAGTTKTYFYLGTNVAASLDYGSAATTSNRLIILGSANDVVSSGQGNDTIYGGAGGDNIAANVGDDRVYGQEGNDTIQAGQGDDIVFGDAGSDIIDGGSTGNDQLTGGSGADQFRFSSTSGKDTVTDFSLVDGDKIALKGGVFGSTEPNFVFFPLSFIISQDFDRVSTISNIRSDTGLPSLGNDQIYVVTNAQTFSQIHESVPTGAIKSYALVFDSTSNYASLYYDPDWATVEDRVEVASFTGMSLADLLALSASNFVSWG